MSCLSPACRSRRLLAAVALLACALPALPDGLKESRQGEYTIVSGGNDEDELAQLEKLAPRHQIQLLFLRSEDKAGLPGVRVRVRNTAGDLVVDGATCSSNSSSAPRRRKNETRPVAVRAGAGAAAGGRHCSALPARHAHLPRHG